MSQNISSKYGTPVIVAATTTASGLVKLASTLLSGDSANVITPSVLYSNGVSFLSGQMNSALSANYGSGTSAYTLPYATTSLTGGVVLASTLDVLNTSAVVTPALFINSGANVLSASINQAISGTNTAYTNSQINGLSATYGVPALSTSMNVALSSNYTSGIVAGTGISISRASSGITITSTASGGLSNTNVIISTTSTSGVPLTLSGINGQTGNLLEGNVSGVLKFKFDNDGSLTVAGSGTPTTLSNLKINSYNTLNGFIQNNIQNLSNGNGASSDWVATTNNGNDTSGFVNFGINGSGFTTTSAWNINGASDAYLYSASSNLAIGTGTSGKNIVFFTGGTLSGNAKLTLNDNGSVSGVSGNLLANTSGLAIFAGNGINVSKSSSGVTISNPSSGFYKDISGNVFANSNVSFLGANCVAIGLSALNSATVNALDCVAIGNKALNSDTYGSQNVAIGSEAMGNSTTISYSVGIGYRSLLNGGGGSNNTAVGSNAMGNTGNSNCSNNVGVGSSALGNIRDNYNTAIGYGAMGNKTNGTYNIGVGVFSLSNNPSGSNNTAIGYSSLNSSVTSNNIGIGYNANVSGATVSGATQIDTGINTTSDTMQYRNYRIADVSGLAIIAGTGISLTKGTTGVTINSTVSGGSGTQQFFIDANNNAIGNGGSTLSGTGNVAIGYQTLNSNSTGWNNVAIGYQSLLGNTTGQRNVSIGEFSLGANKSGGTNTSIGYASMASNTSGVSNSSYGYNSLSNNLVGNYNSSIGYQSLANTTTSNNIGIGYNANVSGSTVSGATQIDVGVNVTSDTMQYRTWRIASDATSGLAITAGNGISLTKGTTGVTVASSLSSFTNDVDAGNYKLSNVYIQNVSEAVNALGTVTGSFSIPVSAGNVVTMSLTGAVTVTSFTAIPATGRSSTITLMISNNGSGTITWPSSPTVKWPSATPPTLTSTNGNLDIISFTTVNNGTNWYGILGGGNY